MTHLRYGGPKGCDLILMSQKRTLPSLREQTACLTPSQK